MRALLLILDSVGCGHAPDAAAYGDTGADTLGHIFAAQPALALPALFSLGLGKIMGLPAPAPRASYGRMRERSAGKDTTTGHWEIAGVILDQPFATYAKFPAELIRAIEREASVTFIGNYPQSGTVILAELGAEHVRTGHPILYTSADSVLQIAAHESIIPLPRLYEICTIARRHADAFRIGRIIARPFTGEPGAFARTSGRHDFSAIPPRTILNALADAGLPVHSVGKISDIFAASGITRSTPTASNAEGMAAIDTLWAEKRDGLIFANLVDFDMHFGHRRDVPGYANALLEFDRWLATFLPHCAPDDLVIITADHGNDPTWPGTDHTREEVPLLVHHASRHDALGTRQTFADIAATLAGFFHLAPWPVGKTFFPPTTRSITDSTAVSNMHVPTFIERKRDGAELDAGEIAEFIRGYSAGEIPDYQASAFAMAVFFRGMTAAETSALTRAMMQSGNVLRYPAGSPPKVDKHSTGGIGDKVSLVLAPLLACDDLWVPMISGRGLGITGGTLDKMESIPGFNVALSEEQTLAQLARLGVAMIGQTSNICPADKKLYALRDVTATVQSPPLIVASIMSKKLAESLDRLVLDVKFGSGAFMKTRGEAAELAAALTAVGREMGVKTSHLLTPMDEPLGRTAGNALEVAEAVECLRGGGPQDMIDLTLDLAGKVADAPRAQLAQWLQDGTAWNKFVAMVEAQGGDPTALERITEIHRAPIIHEVRANQSGHVTRMDAGGIGRACVLLGAGRAKASDAIDFAVGVSAIRSVGAAVARSEPLLRVHARSEASLRAALPLIEAAVAVA